MINNINNNIELLHSAVSNLGHDDDYNSYYESLYKLIESDISNDVKLWINKLNN